LFAISPIALVTFRVMVAAESEPAVVSVTTVPGIREDDVIVFVVANPMATAIRPNQLPRLAAQTAL
jgi:hypothetical protein